MNSKMKPRLFSLPVFFTVAAIFTVFHGTFATFAASFPGDAQLEVDDPTGALSWDPASGALTWTGGTMSPWYGRERGSRAILTADPSQLAPSRSRPRNAANSLENRISNPSHRMRQ